MRSRGGRRHEFSVRDGLAALLEPVDPPAEAGGDLLAEERELARKGRWWRPWWLRTAVSEDWVPGRGGAVAAGFVLLALVGWLVFLMTGGGRSLVGVEEFGWDVSSDYSGSELAGRVLRAEEVEMALAFGEPVELGVSGMPVVIHGVTGIERELTPFEVDFFEEYGRGGFSGVPLGVNRVRWNAGPQGWGMWWKSEAIDRFAQPELAYTREGWRGKQELELQWAGDWLSDAALVVDRLEDPGVRVRGLGADLAAVLDRAMRRYPSLQEGGGVAAWGALPGKWVCSEDLELALSLGVTQGCPVLELQGVLGEVWGALGAVYLEMARMARLLNYMDGLSTEDYFRSGRVPSVYFGVVDLLEGEIVNLSTAVEKMRRLSVQRELYISVEFLRSGG